MSTYIIGVGMSRDTFTSQALSALDEADIIIGAERMLGMTDTDKEKICEYSSERIADIVNSTDRVCAVLMSGDTGFYSGAERLAKLIPDAVVIPGISSVSYLSSKTGISWQSAKLISLHGRDRSVALAVKLNRNVFVLLGGKNNAGEVCRRLCEYGLGYVTVYVGERLGQTDEHITCGTASSLSGKVFNELSCMVTDNPDISCVRYGIDDKEFEREEKIPMTKSEIRAVIMSKLGIDRNDIVWDIGCGSGSVSVEASLAANDGKVYAIDCSEKAVLLTKRNLVKFSCDNAEVIHGTAPMILGSLPAPDRVFIGGTSGRTAETAVYIKNLYPEAKIVMTAVTLETLNEISKLEGYEIIQLYSARGTKLGSYTLMRAENPVYIAYSL